MLFRSGTDIFTGCEHLGRDASVFQAEVLAINRAADMLLDQRHKTIVFKSDSQSALRALTNKTIKSSLVKDCADTLNKLAVNNTVRLQWVKAHIGIHGNEKADAAAKQGARSYALGCEPWLPVSHNKLNKMVSAILTQKWQDRWQHLDSCRQSRMALPCVGPRPSNFMQTLSREEACRTIQFLTGHANLRRHQFLRSEVTDPACRICDFREETPEHLLIRCPDLKPLRQSQIGRAHV